MSSDRPKVLSIAGFDPSGGAGVLADVKTLEQLRVYAMAIITANTIQTENEFAESCWTDIGMVVKSIESLAKSYSFVVIKIGIVPSLPYLQQIIAALKKYCPRAKIIWDTVIKSSTGFSFITMEKKDMLENILSSIDLITPNYEEIQQLSFENIPPEAIAKNLSGNCMVLLKGGHHPALMGTDYLFVQKEKITLLPNTKNVFAKHGSGCVLSSAIAAYLAHGFDTETACRNAKTYIEKFLSSSTALLGNHVA